MEKLLIRLDSRSLKQTSNTPDRSLYTSDVSFAAFLDRQNIKLIVDLKYCKQIGTQRRNIRISDYCQVPPAQGLRKSQHTNEPILDVQYGRVSVEQDLYLYKGVVERLQRPKPLDYQMWAHMRAHMRATAVHSSTVLRFGMPRLMTPALGLREKGQILCAQKQTKHCFASIERKRTSSTLSNLED